MLDFAFSEPLEGGTLATGDPHSFMLSVARQISVEPKCRMLRPSVVFVGTVHVSITALPLRVARKSLTGCASSSEGGNGAPGLPQAESSARTPAREKVSNLGRSERKSIFRARSAPRSLSQHKLSPQQL